MVDRYSSFVHAEDMGMTAMTPMVWARVMKLCTILGFPRIIRTDLGPEFRDSFSKLCRSNSVIHQQCSVEFHSSNGSAERAVKTAKMIIRKCSVDRSSWALAIFYLNSTPRRFGLSPAEMLLKRRPNSALPDLRAELTMEEIEDAAGLREARELERHAKTNNRRELSKLKVGDRVRVFNSKSKKFDRTWVVIAARESGRSYVLKDEVTEQVYVRNRTHLLPCPEPAPINVVVSKQTKALKPALKNKLTRKRVNIIHPHVSFTIDVETFDEEGKKELAEMNMGEDDYTVHEEETAEGGQ